MRLGTKNHDDVRDIDHVRVIERRIEWLEKRIKHAAKAKYSSHYDRSERDALVWLLETVKQWVDLPNEDDELKDF